ncbi:MAG: hypothetical protein ACTSQG_01805, partial [Promethearchaeota archaeon]
MKKGTYLKIYILFIFAALILNQITFLGNDNTSTTKKNKSSSDYSNIKTNQLEWVIMPTLNNKYFSPDTTPGNGDKVIYSFAVNQPEDYSLNISAYYDPIDNYPGFVGLGDQVKSAGYLMPNGTWLIVGLEHRLSESKDYIWLGKGTNASNMVWQQVSQVKNAVYFAVAGDASSKKIRIAYVVYNDNANSSGIKCFSSDNWGKTWAHNLIHNYTSVNEKNWWLYQSLSVYYYGLSIGAFNGKFTCMWGATVNGQYENCTILESEDLGAGWSAAKNLTALQGFGYSHPQVIYNQTDNDGTLYVAYDKYDSLMADLNSSIIELGNGINNPATDKWDFDPWGNVISNYPIVYWAKDYKTNRFYILDGSDKNQNKGLRNATWGQDISNRTKDRFQTECKYSFNLYANNGPKCFSGSVQSDDNFKTLGILDCKTPFNVRTYNGTTSAYKTVNKIFDGKDKEGNSREAMAYSFNLKVGTSSEGLFDLIVYVDNEPVKVNYTPSANRISPFTSPGINDKFTIDIEADKSGIATLNIRSLTPINRTYELKEDLDIVQYPVLCGDGLNNYLFFINYADPIKMLMFTKSSDGGLSWEDPVMIDSSVSSPYSKLKAHQEGQNLYLWDSYGNFYTSSDLGETFFEDNQFYTVEAVSDDGACFFGMDTGFFGNKFSINRSLDYGYQWEGFCTINLPDADNYTLEDAAYDPISGNYSFIIAHKVNKSIYFISVSNDGSKYTLSGNLMPTGYTISNIYREMFDLEVRGNSEWIITTTAKNKYKYNELSSVLSYSVSTNGVTFSNWANFTDINGKKMSTIAVGKHWDIIFPENGYPCFITGIVETFPFLSSFNITSKSNFIFGRTEELDENYEAQLSFNGVTTTGDILPDGNYTWSLELVDIAGYCDKTSGWVYLDNTAPVLVGSDPLTSPKSPYPMNKTKITVPIEEANYDTCLLYYRVPGGGWNITKMTVANTKDQFVNFTGVIYPQNSSVTTVFWKVVVNDTCGNYLVLDNNGQLYSYGRGVYEYVKQSGALSPTLYDDWKWSYIFTSGYDHLDKVWLRKEFEGSATIDIEIQPSGSNNNTFSINIAHNLVYLSAVYKFMFRTDIGQEFIIEEIALERPDVRIEEDEEPPSTLDLSEDDSYTVRIVASDGGAYIEYVYIEYQFDDGSSKKTELLEYTGHLYEYTFDDFPAEATSLTYRIFAVDIYGNEVELEKERTINIIPELPTWEMTPEAQILILILSLIIGVSCGFVFSFVTSRKGAGLRDEKLLRRSGIFAIKDEKITDRKEMSKKLYESIEMKKKISIILTLISFTIFSIMGFFFIGMELPALSMLFFIGAFLTATILWVLLSAELVVKNLRSAKYESAGKDKLILFAISILIYYFLLMIFISGNSIAWWRVRVNQLSYNIAGIVVPKALTTVTTTFFSSILLLTASTFKEVSNKVEELKQAESLNENPLIIIKRREKAISSVISNVGKKGILFVTIIGV